MNWVLRCWSQLASRCHCAGCVKLRTKVPIVGISDNESTLQQMCLYWGVTPLPGVSGKELHTIIEQSESGAATRATSRPVIAWSWSQDMAWAQVVIIWPSSKKLNNSGSSCCVMLKPNYKRTRLSKSIIITLLFVSFSLWLYFLLTGRRRDPVSRRARLESARSTCTVDVNAGHRLLLLAVLYGRRR